MGHELPISIGSRVRQGSGENDYGFAEVVSLGHLVGNVRRIRIRFDDTGSERECIMRAFIKGEVKDFFKPIVYGVGYLGDAGVERNARKSDAYTIWKAMLRRSTDVGRGGSGMERCSTYNGTRCSAEFCNFTLFRDFYNNVSNINDLRFYISNYSPGWSIQLDKDILGKNSLLYSRDTCCLVPNFLNKFVILSVTRTQNYPCGVVNEGSSLRIAIESSYTCSDDNIDDYLKHENICFGRYVQCFNIKSCNDAQDRDEYIEYALKFYKAKSLPYKEEELAAIGMAFATYKAIKEAYIRSIARDLYNKKRDGRVYHLITKECYEALMNWDIRIEDC